LLLQNLIKGNAFHMLFPSNAQGIGQSRIALQLLFPFHMGIGGSRRNALVRAIRMLSLLLGLWAFTDKMTWLTTIETCP
jgi:hypothetical protein